LIPSYIWQKFEALEEQQDIISRKDVVRIISIVISNWYFLVLIPLLFFGGSYIYTHRIADVYAAKCQILLKSNETYDYQQQIYKGLGFNSKYASYEETASQMRVIKSSNLIDEVLNSLSLDVAYFIVGRLKVSEVYRHMPFLVESDERSSAFSGMKFDLRIIDQNSFNLSYEVNGVSSSNSYDFGELILDDGLYLRVKKQKNLNDVSVETLKQIDYMFKVFKKGDLIRKYKSQLEVQNLDYTSIVEITLKDEISERAVEILDTLAKIYVANTVQNKIEINENTVQYIDKQLDEVIDIINEIESELEKYKEQKAILNLNRDEENYYSRYLDLENEIREIDGQISSIDELITYLLKNEDVETLLPPSIFVNDDDPTLAKQVTELYTLRSEYSRLRSTGGSENPKLKEVHGQIQDLKEDLLLYLDVRKQALSERKEILRYDVIEYREKIKNIPKSQRDILNIQRRLVVNEELYSFLLSKRAETVIAKAGLVPETKIIESARPVGSVYPNKLRMNLTNMLIGLLLAVLLVLVRVLFFQKITNIGQLQTLTDISILGSIPKVQNFSKTYRILSGNEKTELVQAFRALRTNLQYFSKPSNCTTVLVTSLLPGEGKTFSSVNLASVLAIAEKKVLIVDFDLHKPRLAKAMELSNEEGMSSYLIGKSKLEDIIKPTQLKHLDVITSGPVPPNASELLLRKEIDEIFEYAEKHYDYVLLDTPPVSLISDGLILMRHVDIKMFVLNSRSTSKTSLDYIERLIQKNNLDDCTLVLNEERTSRLNYYYSKYGYGGYGFSGYGYAYSQPYDDSFSNSL